MPLTPVRMPALGCEPADCWTAFSRACRIYNTSQRVEQCRPPWSSRPSGPWPKEQLASCGKVSFSVHIDGYMCAYVNVICIYRYVNRCISIYFYIYIYYEYFCINTCRWTEREGREKHGDQDEWNQPPYVLGMLTAPDRMTMTPLGRSSFPDLPKPSMQEYT